MTGTDRMHQNACRHRSLYSVISFWRKVRRRSRSFALWGLAGQLLRVRHARDIARVFADAHRQGNSIGRRGLACLCVDSTLSIVPKTLILEDRISADADDALLGRTLAEILDDASLRTALPQHVTEYLNAFANVPSAMQWQSALTLLHDRLEQHARLTSVVINPATILEELKLSAAERYVRAGVMICCAIALILIPTLYLSSASDAVGEQRVSRPTRDSPASTAGDATAARIPLLAPAGSEFAAVTNVHVADASGQRIGLPMLDVAKENERIIEKNPAENGHAIVERKPPITPQTESSTRPILSDTKTSLPSIVENLDFAASWIMNPGHGGAILRITRGRQTEEVQFIRVPAGRYEMGSLLSPDESPKREIDVPEFYLAKFEMTANAFALVHSSDFRPQDNGPAGEVDWHTAKLTCERVKRALGKHVQAARLPWEFEWEYIAQKAFPSKEPGTVDARHLSGHAWIGEDPVAAVPHPVGTKRPDGLGIHDLLGNVAEWMEDAYSDSAYLNKNPRGQADGIMGVVRGGSCITPITDARVTRRYATKRDVKDRFIGFRMVVIP